MDRSTALTPPPPRDRRVGSAAIPLAVAIVVVGLSLPVIIEGAPLADDFNNCLAPMQRGLGTFMGESWDRLGIIRSARFAEILLTTGVCRDLPFGIAIGVSLALYLSVAAMLRKLLVDLGVPRPWPDLGAALWLLQPLGTEAALWPAALHVPLGLLLGLLSLRAFRAGRSVLAALSALGAFLCVEQAILALPLVAWLVAPKEGRLRAALIAGSVSAVAFLAFTVWPGNDPRLDAGLVERLRALAAEPAFVIEFPAVGLGIHSIPLALVWGFPWSVLAVVAGGAAGIRWVAPLLQEGKRGGSITMRDIVFGAALLIAINLPVVLNVPKQGSPRVFSPTWLAVAALAAVVGPRLRWRRLAAAGALAGAFSAAALLSMAFSISVRVSSADFVRYATEQIAETTRDGDEIVLCDVRRTIVDSAPRGAFAVHEFIYDWASQDALYYYTGRKVSLELFGEVWGTQCPSRQTPRKTFDLDVLIASWNSR